MSHHREETGNEGGGKFHTVQASRDLEANWEVDLANKLEDYLLKIFSGEIIANGEECQIRVNFAEGSFFYCFHLHFDRTGFYFFMVLLGICLY